MRIPDRRGTIDALVDDFYQPLYRYAYRLSGSAADADDLTQEAFCQAQRKLGQLRDVAKAKSWLFSILRNLYLQRNRDDPRRRYVSLDQVAEIAEPPAEPLPEIDPECLQEALDDLDEAFRTPLILYYFEEFSYREIAEQMELPIGTVMSRLARAKNHLRNRLQTPRPMVAGPAFGRANDGV